MGPQDFVKGGGFLSAVLLFSKAGSTPHPASTPLGHSPAHVGPRAHASGNCIVTQRRQ